MKSSALTDPSPGVAKIASCYLAPHSDRVATARGKDGLDVTRESLLIEVKNAGAGLEVVQEGGEGILVLGPQTIHLALSPTSIVPLGVPYLESCTLPDDTIGNPTVLI